MPSIPKFLNVAAAKQFLYRPATLGGLFLAGVAATASFLVVGQSAPPNIKAVDLASDPLYAATSGDKPTLVMALSVEYPTVGAQYVRGDGSNANTEDPTYANTNEYLGYYDAESCYSYNDTPTEDPATGLTKADYKRFQLVGKATAHKCADAFSGNFLNWATNSAIDMLRLSLSGGDRYIDTPDLTVLQRAFLPDGVSSKLGKFWNGNNFPAKMLQRDGGGAGSYWGAVPNKMATAAKGSDIWVANAQNKVYFGTSKIGDNIASAGSYSLTKASPSTGPYITKDKYQTPSSAVRAFNGKFCASEDQACRFSGTKEILYGANDQDDQPGGWITFVSDDDVICSNNVTGTFNDPAPGISKSCYFRNYSGKRPADTNALNSDGFFYARVQVCASDSGAMLQDTRDYAFCTRQPSGKFKPTGAIQRYSDQLRLAAFGYLIDQTASYNNGRYGGALRAPMKYVGQKTFNTTGQDNTPAGGNPIAEWDANTGVFLTNPDGDKSQTPNISGVVNYLNKFGRTGSQQGRYKIYDPVSELYYETLRYLQGLDPSKDAVKNLTADMYDGFPVFTDWSKLDPYDGRSSTGDYSCLRSNIVVIGDVNTHDGSRFPAVDASKNIPDIGYWTGIVQNFEKNVTSSYLDGENVNRTTGNPNGANSDVQNDSTKKNIMGLAYWARTHDIRGKSWTDKLEKQRPGLRIKTFTFDVNEYGDQTRDANTRRNKNQFFTAAKYGGFETDASNPGKRPFNAYGNPFKQQSGTDNNDVWQKRDAPGEAASYYLQSSARGVLSAFEEIFSRASSSARSIAGSASQGRNITQEGSVIFQGTFDTADWSGDVLAVPISVNAENTVSIGAANYWTAATQLATQTENSRNIVVGKKAMTAVATATPFQWGAIDADLKADLAKLTPTAASDSTSTAEDRLDYLRGDRTKEGSFFRLRNKLLGDVVNSAIAYSGRPSVSVIGTTYSKFYNDNRNRTPAIFVGANDGMLHAFNATTGQADSGKEMFAYIPSWMGPKLAALTDKGYINNHQSYVDAPPVVAEALLGSGSAATDWRTVLVGGTGAGGRGVYALDVTDPTAFGSSKVLWEFKASDDADMGHVVGRPQILKLRTSALGSTATYKYYAVVPSGVNNYVPQNGVYSVTGKPTLFILDLTKPAGTAWTLGTNYYKISFPINNLLATTTATGVVNFRAALGTAGEVNTIFAGDLHGNLWKMVFAKPAIASPTDWTMEKLSGYRTTTPIPLYIARDTTNKVQPITVAPTLVRGESASVTYVAFGTGKYLETSDRNSTATNSVYAVYDDLADTSRDGGSSDSVIAGRGRLQAGTVTVSTGTVAVPAFRWGRASSNSDSTKRSGWYFDLPASGERQISNATVFGDYLVFGSLIPGVSGGANTCGAAGGGGNEYIVNIDTGVTTFRSSTVGILGEPLMTEVPSATTYGEKDNTGRRKKTIWSQIIQQGSKDLAPSGQISNTVDIGRLSWRQIHNYKKLHQDATKP